MPTYIKGENVAFATNYKLFEKISSGSNDYINYILGTPAMGSVKTISGVTYTENDGSVSATGTSTSSSIFEYWVGTMNLPANTYYLSGCPTGGSSDTYKLVVEFYGGLDGSMKYQCVDVGNGSSFVVDTDQTDLTMVVYIEVMDGTTIHDKIFYPILSDTEGAEWDGGTTYTQLAENTSINFEVSALGLPVGDHTLVVQASAEGYEDSYYSNEVIYSADASDYYLLYLDFTSKTVADYISDGVLELADSTADGLTYDSSGLICNDTDLCYGLKLSTPISVAQSWTVETTMTISAFADSGTTSTEAAYKNLAILSNNDDHETHANTCLAPVVMNNGWAGGVRLTENNSASLNLGLYFVYDGAEHTYKFTFDATTGVVEMFVDGESVSSKTWPIDATPVAGTFGYVLGIHTGYSYSKNFHPQTGYKIKTVKVYN